MSDQSLGWYIERQQTQNDTGEGLGSKEERLLALRKMVERCGRCPLLVKSRALYPYGKPTFGYGNPNSPVAFIGEAPGKDGCGTTGIPFTKDRSGEFYQRLLREELGLVMKDVWTTNIVKCCPEDNRKPDDREVSNCNPFLLGELSIIHPNLIVPLGATAARNFVPLSGSLAPFVGAISQFNSPPWVDWGPNVYVLYHPAFILRDMSREQRYRELFRQINKWIGLDVGKNLKTTQLVTEQVSEEVKGVVSREGYQQWEAPPTYKRWEADRQRELEQEWKRNHQN
jgi:DNA polymerase